MKSDDKLLVMATLEANAEIEIKPLVTALWENDLRCRLFEVLSAAARINSSLPNFQMTADYAAATARIVTTWTMFESLAVDLWIACVDTFPDPLAQLKGKPWGKSTGEDIGVTEEQSKGPMLSVRRIHKATKGTYDIQGQMGGLLYECGNVSFIGLDGIRDAYYRAFQTNENPKFSPLELLKKDSLNVLNALRNVIVHHAGCADSKYMESTLSDLPKVKKKGDKIGITLESSARVCEPVFDLCVTFLVEADKWMKAKRRILMSK